MLKDYYKNLKKILLTEKQIQKKIKKIAREIEKDYKNKELILICNLKGSFRFLSDLIKYLNIPLMIDFIAFKSYEGKKSTQLRIIKDLKMNVKNKNVIVVEDIVDTGKTLNDIIKYLKEFKSPASIKVCALLDKPSLHQADIKIDYKGFEIDNHFIVGYGLDFNEYFRELNDIYILK